MFDVQLLGNIHFHTDPGWDTDAIVGQFSSSLIIVGEETYVRKNSHQIVLPPTWINLTNVGHIQSSNPKQCTELREVLMYHSCFTKCRQTLLLVIFECLATICRFLEKKHRYFWTYISIRQKGGWLHFFYLCANHIISSACPCDRKQASDIIRHHNILRHNIIRRHNPPN